MARGFVLGATAGRTTLTGEGLQHADGHSQLLAAAYPHVVAYDPAYGYEIAHIVKDGLRRMYGGAGENGAAGSFGGEDVLYYITMYNEPYVQPAEPSGLDVDGLLRGMYLLAPAAEAEGRARAQLLASGVGVRWALEAQQLLADDWSVGADVWSVTSWGELNRDGVAVERERLRHPDREAGVPYVTQALADATGPVVAVSDWMRAVPEQIRPWVPGSYVTLGTDGFGFPDTRPAARRYFNTDAESVVVAVLAAWARDGSFDASVAATAADRYRIDDVMAAPEQTSDSGVA
jgi:pyruvate dehydrogenase E1 component